MLRQWGSWNYETKECEKDNWENEIDTSAIDFILNSKTIENQKIQLQVKAFKEKILLTKNSEKSIEYGLENTQTTTEKELNLLFQKGILKIENDKTKKQNHTYYRKCFRNG